MVQINFAHKEIQCKIVYYGPGMSGKTTNLELVHEKTPGEARGELTSIATTGERTLYFDYMPLDLGSIAGIRTKFQLYTVPGQIYYKSTRRLVLQGVDGIVFVADSSASKLEENKESMRDLEDNLKEMGRAVGDLPIVIQYNKRDIPDAMSIEDLQKQLNVHNLPYFEAIAPNGQGVFQTLKGLASLVLEAVNRSGIGAARAPRAVPAGVPSAAAPSPTPGASAKVGPSGPAPAATPNAAAAGARTAHPSGISYAPRVATAASSGNVAVAEQETAVATRPAPVAHTSRAQAPAPAPSAGPLGAPVHAPFSAVTARPVADRMVTVSGLSQSSGSGGRWLFFGLVALIGTAVWFVFTQLVK